MMKKVIGLVCLVGLLPLLVVISTRNPGDYHLREFEAVKTNFNDYRLSLSDRLVGIHDNASKWDYHLEKLEELGTVKHQTFVFSNVPFTRETSRRIWRAANSNFPAAVMVKAKSYGTNDSRYGVQPFMLEVWDFPSNTLRWSSFFRTNNDSDQK